MQNIDFKRGEQSSNINLAISRFLESHYKRKPEDFHHDLKRLEEFRNEALQLTASSSAINKLIRYYGQLVLLASKFPFDEDNLKVTFSWTNFQGKNTSKPISSFDIHFEQASVLFNLAILNMRLGNVEGKGNQDRLRKGCNFYLVAAGIFQSLQSKYCNVLSLPVGADLTESVITALHQLALAQAQECFVLKGLMDKNIRDPMMAKLCHSTANMYSAAFDFASREKSIFPQGWLSQCNIKALYFTAMANYKKSCEMIANSQYGDEICRLQLADTALKEAKSLLDAANKGKDANKNVAPELATDIASLNVNVLKNLERAQKDNDLIYHENVTSRDKIGDIGVAVVAHPIAMPALTAYAEIIEEPLFDSLASYSLHQVILSFFEKRDKMARDLVQQLEAKKHSIDSSMAGMNLPAALDAREEPIGIPQCILEKSAEVKSQGGSESLESSRKTLQTLRGECLETLSEIDKILTLEEANDAEMREQFGQKWARKPSSELNKHFKDRLESITKTLKIAGESDDLVAKRFNEHIVNILNLCSSREDLEACIPACIATTMPQINQAAVTQLRRLIEGGKELQSRIDVIIEEVSNVSRAIDGKSFITDQDGDSKASNSLKTSRAADDLSDAELAIKFEPIRQRIQNFSMEIDSHLGALRTTFDAFNDRSSHQTALSERAEAMRVLEDAYTQFITLSANFAEGIQFYNKCLESLQALMEEVLDFRTSRKFEHQDLLRSIAEVAAKDNMGKVAEMQKDEREKDKMPKLVTGAALVDQPGTADYIIHERSQQEAYSPQYAQQSSSRSNEFHASQNPNGSNLPEAARPEQAQPYQQTSQSMLQAPFYQQPPNPADYNGSNVHPQYAGYQQVGQPQPQQPQAPSYYPSTRDQFQPYSQRMPHVAGTFHSQASYQQPQANIYEGGMPLAPQYMPMQYGIYGVAGGNPGFPGQPSPSMPYQPRPGAWNPSTPIQYAAQPSIPGQMSMQPQFYAPGQPPAQQAPPSPNYYSPNMGPNQQQQQSRPPPY